MSEIIGDLMYPSNAIMRAQANQIQKDMVQNYATLTTKVEEYNTLAKSVYAIACNNMSLIAFYTFGKSPQAAKVDYQDTSVSVPDYPNWASIVTYMEAFIFSGGTVLPLGYAAYKYFSVVRNIRNELEGQVNEFIEARGALSATERQLANLLTAERDVALVEANGGDAVALRNLRSIESVQEQSQAIVRASAYASRATNWSRLNTALAAERAAARMALIGGTVTLLVTIGIELIVSAVSAKQTNDALTELLDDMTKRRDSINAANDAVTDRLARLKIQRTNVVKRFGEIYDELKKYYSTWPSVSLDENNLVAVMAQQTSVQAQLGPDVQAMQFLRKALADPQYNGDYTQIEDAWKQIGAPSKLEEARDLVQKFAASTTEFFLDPY